MDHGMSIDADFYVRQFCDDIKDNGGYRYTTNAPLSSRMANERLTVASLAVADLGGRRALDIGCGDGTYTRELYDRGRPLCMHGLDPAEAAIEIARRNTGERKLTFSLGSAYELPFPHDHFDIAYLRGGLHHRDRPENALRESLRVARRTVVIEPNGYSPVLKVLERVSPYHRAHGEKSYSPRLLRRWIGQLGGRVTEARFVGLVPMFAPDLLAKVCKTVEPAVEGTPVVRSVACAVYLFVATRATEAQLRGEAA